MTHDNDQRQKREAALRVLRVSPPSATTDAHTTASAPHVPTPAELSSAVAQFDGETPRSVTVSSLTTLRGGPARATGGFAIVRPEADTPAGHNVQPFAPRKGE